MKEIIVKEENEEIENRGKKQILKTNQKEETKEINNNKKKRSGEPRESK